MQMETEMRARLMAAFAVSDIKIENQSHLHAGHAGHDGSGESHFHLRLRAPELAAMGRIDRHRAVQRALGDLTTRIHALAMDLG